MKYIILSQNKFALVDDKDFEELNKHKWHLTNNYVGRYETGKSHATRKHISMHRFIMNAPFNKQVDHKNHNKLDNRRENLRICTQTQNNGNMITNNRYGYKGIELRQFNGNGITLRKKPWRATLSYEGKVFRSMNFENKEQAALAYNELAIKYHGEFAQLNQL